MSLLEILIAMVVLGFGVLVYMRMQSGSSGLARGNADLHRAGKLIEKHVETVRVRIAQDPAANWPPLDTSFADPTHPHIGLVSRVKPAHSPKDGALLPGVRELEIAVGWGPRALDSMRVTTYVSKSF